MLVEYLEIHSSPHCPRAQLGPVQLTSAAGGQALPRRRRGWAQPRRPGVKLRLQRATLGASPQALKWWGAGLALWESLGWQAL